MRPNEKRAQRNAAWSAGVAFGRARRTPTALDLTPWTMLDQRDAFLCGYRHGRRGAPRMVQACLPFPPVTMTVALPAIAVAWQHRDPAPAGRRRAGP